MQVKIIYKGGPLDLIEELHDGAPRWIRIVQIFQNDDEALRYDVHLYNREGTEFKDGDIIPYLYDKVVDTKNINRKINTEEQG